ncbi:MAG: hypothetical protein WBR18_08235 [Anaerolineales bacterium]
MPEPARPALGSSPLRWAVGLGLFGVLERIALAWVYQPVAYGDTPTYFRLAGVLTAHGVAGYDATRVPGYPLFIAALGQEETTVWLAQLALGLLISLLVFFIAWRMTDRPSLALFSGLAYDLIAGQMLFEHVLLSETLATFLLLATIAGFLLLIRDPSSGSAIGLAVGIGLLASLTGMVRTLFFILPVVLFPFIMMAADRWRQRLLLAAAFSLPPLIILGGWIGFVYQHYGMMSPTTIGGYHLIQHTGAFFEYLPEQEAVIRDTYLAYRDQQIADRGVQTNAIWEAIPELSERTGLSFFALSEKLQQLSIQLIKEHPVLYLRSAAQGWLWFWKAPVYWQPDAMWQPVSRLMRIWAWVGRGVSLLANAAFLLLAAGIVLSQRLRARLRPTAPVVMLAGLVGASSIVQTLVDHGDNPRFLMPLQMVVIVIVLWASAAAWPVNPKNRVVR